MVRHKKYYVITVTSSGLAMSAYGFNIEEAIHSVGFTLSDLHLKKITVKKIG